MIRIERGYLASWQADSVLPQNWAGFTISNSSDYTYDTWGRKVTETEKGQDGAAVSLKQFSYDAAERVQCVAQRMNPAVYESLPASACALGAQGAAGPDRITRYSYDSYDQVSVEERALGTAVASTVRYVRDGGNRITQLTDERGYVATMAYDSLGRQTRWNFPVPTTTGQASATDYESYTYDANGNRTSLRKRDGSVISFQYDALNRMSVKAVPERAGLPATHTRDVHYGYDLLGRQLYARFDSPSGEGVTNSWNGFGERTAESLTMDGVSRTIGSSYDANGNRTQLIWPDLAKTSYTFDGLNRPHRVLEGDYSSPYPMVTYGYNSAGSLAVWSRYYGGSGSFSYDTAGRLAGLSHDVAGSSNDVSFTFTRNPASQIIQETRNNDAFAWTGAVNIDRPYSANGLNQYTTAGSASFAYDANGNLTSDGTNTYVYDVENRLVGRSGGGSATLRYDPLGRLYEVNGSISGITRFAYDGDALVGEYNSSGTLLRRYVHGSNAGVDDPLLWYEGSAIGPARWLHADKQGSIIGISDPGVTMIAINAYDEYGIPDDGSQASLGTKGRFRYTGQTLIPELGMYYYKARIYSPTLGRFMQTDPIGYEDQVNLYAYVANDPVNKTDPTGLCAENCPINVFHPELDKQVQPVMRENAGAMAKGLAIGASLFLPVERVGVAIAARALGITGSRLTSLLATRSSVVLGERLNIARSGVASLAEGGGKAIIGAGTKTPLREGERLAAKYGGEAGDYAKVTTGATRTSDGASVQVHAYRNVETGKIYEPKLKIQ